MGQRAKKKVNTGADVMVISNRYEVLTQSDGDYERELQRIDNEREGDTGDPPTKRRPIALEDQVESDMETSGRHNSDSDI